MDYFDTISLARTLGREVDIQRMDQQMLFRGQISVKRIAFIPYSTVPRHTRRQLCTTAIATRPKAPVDQRPAVDVLERSLQLDSSNARDVSSSVPPPVASTSGSKRTIDEGEVLHSLPQHRAWVYGGCALFTALFAKGFSEVKDIPGAAGAVVATLVAYYVSGGLRCTYLYAFLQHKSLVTL